MRKGWIVATALFAAPFTGQAEVSDELAVPASVSGPQQIFTNRAAWEAAGGALLPVEGFEQGNVPPGGAAPCPSPLGWGTNAPGCVDPADMMPGLAVVDVSRVSGSSGLTMYGAGHAGNPSRSVVSEASGHGIALTFDAATRGYAVGVDVQCFPCAQPTPLRLHVYAPGGVVTGSYLIDASAAGQFIGIIDSQDEIWRWTLWGGVSVSEGVDNVTWGYLISAADEETRHLGRDATVDR